MSQAGRGRGSAAPEAVMLSLALQSRADADIMLLETTKNGKYRKTGKSQASLLATYWIIWGVTQH